MRRLWNPPQSDWRPLPRERLAVIAGIVVLGVVYLATLRQGEPWGDNFAMYILQARNIASGHPGAPTGYIYNPHVPKIGPPAYPPAFPLLLAPVYAIWGMNFTPMKVEVVLFFLAALYLVFEFLAYLAPFRYAAGVTAAVGLSPYFWEFKENVQSDLPYLFFCMLALWAMAACERGNWQSVAGALGAAACVYFCFATRTAGVVLIPCLLFCALPRPDGVRRNAVMAGAAALGLTGAHAVVFRGAGSYLDQLGAPWRVLAHQAMAYSWTLRHRFFGIENTAIGLIVLLAMLALGGAGMIIRLRSGLWLPEVFTLGYGFVVVLWTSDEDPRMLIPLLPMGYYYATVAIRGLPARPRAAVTAALIATLCGGYALRYSALDTGPITEGLGDAAFRRVSDYIRAETPRESVVVFDRARLLALTTGRSVSPYHEPASDDALWNYFRSISARYILVDRGYADDADYLEPFLRRAPGRTREVHTDGAFHLYQVL